ncbi:MAG TPA: UdgX family uracil-DNA binding protein, partial [Burkholderiaceae bacterium]
RRTGQTVSVGERRGTVIPIAPERAQPQRALPTTLDECRRCSLWEHATQAVPGTGPRRARVMLIGEQPGDQEDLAGLPFIGPAGQVLDSALREAGLDRGDVYVTNAVKHFKWEPRGKRRLHKTPAQQEVAACRHWLEEEMASVAPDIVVTLGATALKAVLRDDSATLAAHLGQPFRHEGRWIVAVYHPSFVLRAPDSAQRELARAVITAGLQEAAKLLADGEQVRQRER